MLAYILRRALTIIPMLVILSFLIYLGLELTPGDAVSYMIPPDLAGQLTQEQAQELRASLGLDKNFLERFAIWLLGVLQGNFGYSLIGGVPISDIFLDRLPATLELSLAAILISTFLGTLLGVVTAITRGSFTDVSLTIVGMLGLSVPDFFFGLAALSLFALDLGWLPVGGRLLPGYDTFWDRLPHLVLPASVLALSLTAGVMRYSRAAMLDAMAQEFIRTARAKGLPEWRVNLVHGFRVAMTPVIVLVGFRLPALIGGSVVIERVFQWPGVGNEFISAVRAQDYPLVMMIALLSVFAVLLASLLIDVVTALIDPRVRLT